MDQPFPKSDFTGSNLYYVYYKVFSSHYLLQLLNAESHESIGACNLQVLMIHVSSFFSKRKYEPWIFSTLVTFLFTTNTRWKKSLHPTREKVGRWTADEDKRLTVAQMLFGPRNWKKTAQFVPGRTEVQCRERYNQLILLAQCKFLSILFLFLFNFYFSWQMGQFSRSFFELEQMD